ncbi:MAG: signal peptidase II [Pseudomonadota bacterium]
MTNSETKTMDNHARRNIIVGVVIAVMTLVMDQVIKVMVEAELPYGQAVEVLPFFALYYTFNTGIAFSFLNDLSPGALLALAGGVVAIMLALWWQARHEGLVASVGYGLILGGAIGNMIDRAAHGHVIDYVLLYAGQYSFAIFNLADAALTVGVGLIILTSFFQIKKAD